MISCIKDGMHEAGIAQNILDIVLDTAEANNAHNVVKVYVKVGSMTAIEPDCLTFAYDALKEETIASGSTLIIDEVAASGVCNDCKNRCAYDGYIMTCSKCGSFNVELLSGEELQVTEIEVE